MTNNTTGRGWHGDSAGHAQAARARDKFNWWPLLAIPVAFVIGWSANTATNTGVSTSTTNGTEVGIGGGPGSECITPTNIQSPNIP